MTTMTTKTETDHDWVIRICREREELREKLEAADKKIASQKGANAELARYWKQITDLQKRVRDLEVQVSLREAKINKLEKQIIKLEKEPRND